MAMMVCCVVFYSLHYNTSSNIEWRALSYGEARQRGRTNSAIRTIIHDGHAHALHDTPEPLDRINSTKMKNQGRMLPLAIMKEE